MTKHEKQVRGGYKQSKSSEGSSSRKDKLANRFPFQNREHKMIKNIQVQIQFSLAYEVIEMCKSSND